MSKIKDRDGIFKSSRRQFAKTLAAMAATPLLARVTPAQAQEPAAAKPKPPQTPPPDQPSPAAEAMTEVVRIRYGKNLADEQLNEVKRSIDRSMRSADRLKQFKLKNGDEPAFGFSAEVQ